MKRAIVVIATLVMMVTVGCRSSELTRAKVENLLKNSSTHGGAAGEVSVLLRVGKFDDTKNHPQMTEEGADCAFDYGYGIPSEYTVLQQLGYLDIKSTAPKSYLVSMTDKSKQLIAADPSLLFAHAKYGECETDLVHFTVAVAEVDRVTGITSGDSTRRADVHVKWVLTPFGRTLLADGSPFWKTQTRLLNGWVGDHDLTNELVNINTGDASKIQSVIAQGDDVSVQFQKFDDGWRIVDQNGKSEVQGKMKE